VPLYTASDWVDIGHGVSIQKRYRDGSLLEGGVAYRHPHPKTGVTCEGWVSFRPKWADAWDLLAEEPLTMSPSLLCRACGHHGFIENGKWRPCP